MVDFSDVELFVQSRVSRQAWASLLQVSPVRVDRIREVARGSTRIGSHVSPKVLLLFKRLIHRLMDGSLIWTAKTGWQTVDQPKQVCPQEALRCDGVAGIGICPKYWSECKHYVNLETLRACRQKPKRQKP